MAIMSSIMDCRCAWQGGIVTRDYEDIRYVQRYGRDSNGLSFAVAAVDDFYLRIDLSCLTCGSKSVITFFVLISKWNAESR